ncbi:adenylate/guanylate cyclase domain-containing protein [Rhizobium ruizarguesonis]|jgi:adenylate cyclase|uniref:Adenylate/guanylate cyclase domain-containing protein n=1 Tax=Rhizobium ruizarguesonis TaxID=2081791 RepID=A0AAE4YR79_9HYPH|nr:adenylate/guanylate cyclase domain-containing protein [Rhizobium ruizarguesonis]MBY5802691.1 adenylate/guanylate cyclase domain-containing protein [Rhizobium leguminosarum]NKJ74006.1 CHASE2 domain-containing protein [Rhizobium leguminosarum bv. viciae]QIO42691.1 adenylate/guanylate cyclase domain-containing protein [Rhizobium leguminosarum bv. trifolii]MBC2804573.1 adenylate/guanylate cyclase domain-containing protein [Rhizobium ruizarguesonis]MBY5843691.1 adenylate/guanylate cyclase domain
MREQKKPRQLRPAGGQAESRRLRLLVLSLTVLIAISLLSRLPAWSLLELRSFDYLSTVDDPRPPPGGPVIVAIDEPSLADINAQWPWPRSLHAQLVRQLRTAGARVIGLDIIMAEPSNPENDDAITKAVGPDVVLAGDETLIETPQSSQLIRATPLPQLTEAGAVTGIASVDLSGDGAFRRIPGYEDGFAAMLMKASGAAPKALPAGRLIQSFGAARSYPTVSYYQALDPENLLPPDYFKGRVVLVGLSLQNAPAIDKGGVDAFATPYTVHTGTLTSGVEIQATIYDNIRRGLSIAEARLPLVAACILISVLLAAATVWRSTGWLTIVASAVAVLAFAAASFAGIRFAHVFVSPLGPVVAYVSVAFGQAAFDYAEERRNKRQIIRAFAQYISPDLVKRLSNDPSQLKLGGERRTLSVLFSDVRGFTTIAETLKDEPEQLTGLINRLLTPLSDVVMDHGGTIDKYMGDCIMAFWNAPLDDPDHALHAVKASLAMQAAISSLNRELEREAAARGGRPHVLKMGVGINTGECIVGNMGSTRRFDYSCLGDSVNLASRLEGASKNYGVALLLGEETARLVAGTYTVIELDRIIVKGRTVPSPVYTVVHKADAEALAAHRAFTQAKYAGTLAPSDPAFDRLAADIPELAGYYAIVRDALAEAGEE